MQLLLIMLRKNANLTQAAMAKKIGVSVDTYRDKELGRHQFRADEMFLIARLFQLPMEQIFLPRNICNADISVTDKKVGENEESTA